MVISPPNAIYAAPASQFGVPRSNYMGLAADYDKNTADLVTAKISHVATPWLTIENDLRYATYTRNFRYSSVDSCDNTIATGYCNLRAFGIASPGAAAGSFDRTLTFQNVGGGGPYLANSWGVQDILSANADFHVGGFHNVVIAGIDAGYPTRRPHDRGLQPAAGAEHPRSIRWATTPQTAATSAGPCSTRRTSRSPAMRRSWPTPTNLGSDTATSVIYPRAKPPIRRLSLTDRFWFNDQWSLIAGVRVDQYRASYSSTTVGTPASPYPVTKLKSPSFLLDPRASLVFEPDQTQTYYISWAKAADADRHFGGGLDLADLLGGPIRAASRQEREYRDRRQAQPVRAAGSA